MTRFTLTSKKLIGVAAGALIALGAAFPAAAASPLFKFDKTGTGSVGTAFTANAITGSSSELLQFGSPSANQATGSGWVQFTAFTLNSVNVLGTGINNDYQFYALFSLTNTWNGDGTFGGAGSTYTMDALSISLYLDPGLDSVFTPASVTTSTQTAATVAAGATADILLGTGSLIYGTAGLNNPNGVFLNALNTFSLTTPAGTNYFVDPVPFYELVFSGFNNASLGLNQNANGYLAITDAVGVVDFTSVPEPATLALVGAALFGMAGIRRRKEEV